MTTATASPTFVGELLPHQWIGLDFLTSQPRALLADDVGLGKTAQGAALLAHLRDNGALHREGRLPALWVTGKGLIAQTVSELERFAPGLSVAVLGAKQKRSESRSIPDVLVTHHDLAHRRYETLSPLRPVVMMVDEASALKGAGARFDNIRDLCATADRAVALTATPIENNPEELWAMFALIGVPDLPTREEFNRTYCEIQTFDDGSTKNHGWINSDAAHHFMDWFGSYMLRRTAAELGLLLPVKVLSGHELVPLTRAQQAEYNRATFISHNLIRFQRLKAISRRAKDGSSNLMPRAAEFVASAVEGQHKVVLFTEHLADVDELCELLDGYGIGYVSIRGENDLNERADAVASFRDDPNVSVLVGTKVLEYGLNLQHADTLVSAGVSWNPAREAQREGRLCRIGSPHATYRHVAFLPDTPQTRDQLAALERKRQDAAPVMDRPACH